MPSASCWPRCRASNCSTPTSAWAWSSAANTLDEQLDLERDLQRPNQVTTRADIARRISEALKQHEPRIATDLIDVRAEDGGRRLRVDIRYRITATGMAQQLSVAAAMADAVPDAASALPTP